MSEPTPAPEAAAPPPPAPALTEDQTSGRMFVRWNLVTLVIGVIAVLLGLFAARARGEEAGAGAAPADEVGFAADAGWDDGQAEVARYDARRTLYGRERAYTLVRVAVKEPFDRRQGVKADQPGPAVVDAFKVVAVHEVPTGKPYDYRQTTFVHVARLRPAEVLGLTMGSQEWCGNTFVRVLRAGPGFTRVAHSYWDGQADWQDALPAGTWFEDQLPFTVRALPPRALDVSLVPTTLGNKAPRTTPVRARLEVEATDERVTTPAGTFTCVRWACTVGVPPEAGHTTPDRVARYWVALDAPRRPLVKYEDATGAGVLASLERSAYWVATEAP